MRTIGAVAVALIVAIAAPSASAAEATKAPGVGDAAPEVRLADQHGRAFVLGDVLKERAFVVLAFYPKAFTSG